MKHAVNGKVGLGYGALVVAFIPCFGVRLKVFSGYVASRVGCIS
jgi:hypothetical protein